MDGKQVMIPISEYNGLLASKEEAERLRLGIGKAKHLISKAMLLANKHGASGEEIGLVKADSIINRCVGITPPEVEISNGKVFDEKIYANMENGIVKSMTDNEIKKMLTYQMIDRIYPYMELKKKPNLDERTALFGTLWLVLKESEDKE